MVALDLRKSLGYLYKAKPGKVEFLDVPAMNFLMIDGVGSPAAAAFQDAIQGLYSVAYTTKFTFKKSKDSIDFPVMPLEGLWSSPGPEFDMAHPEKWLWTLMIMQPEVVTPDIFEKVRAELIEKKDLPELNSIRLERFDEGRAAQILHVGPYSEEPPTIALLHGEIAKAGLKLRGQHHEIYLGDPRRAAPEKLKTILRQPVG